MATPNIDWLIDFVEKFGNDPDFMELSKRKYHGSIQINFNNGKVVNCDMRQHKTYSLATDSSVFFSSSEEYKHKTPTKPRNYG